MRKFLKAQPRGFYKLCVLCIFKTIVAAMLALTMGAFSDGGVAHGGGAIGQVAGTVTGAAGLLSAGNMIAGKKFDDLCKSADGTKVSCVFAALAFAQAANTSSSGSAAGNTKKAFSASSNDFNFPMDDAMRRELNGMGINNMDDLNRAANNGLSDLAKKDGVKVNPDGTVTTPKGKFPASAFANGASMADAGIIGADEIMEVDKAIKAITDKYKVSAVGIASGGGGGGGSGASGYKYTYNDSGGGYQFNMGTPGAPKTAGLTRTLASGEAIGTSTDNIFEMVHRCYQEKSEEKIFVGQED